MNAAVDLAVERLFVAGGVCWGPACDEPPSRRIGHFRYCIRHATIVHIRNLEHAITLRRTRNVA